MNIKILLWDVDDTLLDFHAAEEAALKKLFREFELGECSGEMLRRYRETNAACWKRLERGEADREELLVGRFREFFRKEGIREEAAEEFNAAYQPALGDTIVYCDRSIDIIRSLRGRVKQYVVSNGGSVAQRKKLSLSGLGELMDGIFISEELGADKPSAAFFEEAFRRIVPASREEMMIIGDTLSSDIRGGMNMGIGTCWYNPQNLPLPEGYRADFIIESLKEVPALL